jgi:3-isopropylmalate/(R)-2-methylmalate dehydratase small subunit
MEPFKTLTGRVVMLPVENIDTDQIIPARFLKTTSKAGLGAHLFADWRYAPDGSPRPDFPLNQPGAERSAFLLAGDNFGCGSSREHAPWALADFGFRAAISSSFGDIFYSNALQNGLLPVVVDAPILRHLMDTAAGTPDLVLKIDLSSQRLVMPDGSAITFSIDAFNKACLLEGIDALGYLLRREDAIAAYEGSHPVRVNTDFQDGAGP